MKKISVALQNFKEIIENGFLYVDKTKQIINCLENKNYFLFTRPRRFGKSLTLSTMKEMLVGNKELFKETYAYNNWDFNKIYPVIYLDFSSGKWENKFSNSYIYIGNDKIEYEEFCVKYNLNKNNLTIALHKINELTKKEAAILIDEYDKFYLDNITNKEKIDEINSYFKNFYSGLKSNNSIIKVLFMSGLTKLQVEETFSGLNNLKDISYTANYSDLVGYTKEDLHKYFGIKEGTKEFDNIKKYYNGYKFGGKQDIYNPWSIGNYIFEEKKLDFYWSDTGTPNVLDVILKKEPSLINNIQELIELKDISFIKTNFKNLIGQTNYGKIFLYTILIQAGYIIIDESNILRIPNIEAYNQLNKYLIRSIGFEGNNTIEEFSTQFIDSIFEKNSSKTSSVLKEYFKYISITRDNLQQQWLSKNQEGVLKALLIPIIFTYPGAIVKTEFEVPSNGKIDFLISIKEKSDIIIEAKQNSNSSDKPSQLTNNAIKQIYEKGYIDEGKKSLLVGLLWKRNNSNNPFEVIIEEYIP